MDPRARLSGILFIVAGGAFLFAGMRGNRAFFVIGCAFIAIGAAFMARARR